MAASGCSGDSEAEAESPPATTTEQPPAVDIVGLRAAFKERFGTPGNEAPWYHFINGLKMAQSPPGYTAVEVVSKFGLGPDGLPACQAIWRLASEFLGLDENGKHHFGVIISDGTEEGSKRAVGCA